MENVMSMPSSIAKSDVSENNYLNRVNLNLISLTKVSSLLFVSSQEAFIPPKSLSPNQLC